MDLVVGNELEKLSVYIRKRLKIKEEEIINGDYLYTLIEKINENFSCIKVEKDNYLACVIENENFVKIKYDDKLDSYKILNFILHSLCYRILNTLDELKKFKLENNIISDYEILNDKNTDYLAKAIMIPKEQFLHELAIFSTNDGFVKVDDMKKKLKIKSIVSRGKDLKIW